MSVKEPVNTAASAGATVDLPPQPSAPAEGRSGGVQTESGHRDIYEVPIQTPSEYREADPTPDSPPASQGVHTGPSGAGTGPTQTPNKK